MEFQLDKQAKRSIGTYRPVFQEAARKRRMRLNAYSSLRLSTGNSHGFLADLHLIGETGREWMWTFSVDPQIDTSLGEEYCFFLLLPSKQRTLPKYPPA